LLNTRAQLGKLTVGDGTRVAVIGIVNRDPNTFFRGSYRRTLKRAISFVSEMVGEGADIIDVGGASTAPGATQISAKRELKRVAPLIKEISQHWDVMVSVDTQSSLVADAALRYGATIVNDVSGLKTDSAMAATISDSGASCIVMAQNRQPGDCKTMTEIQDALEKSLQIASSAGISQEKIVVDPGIGFGKPTLKDLAILQNLQGLRELGHPILIGVSRKAFIGHILGYPSPSQRLAGTLAAVSVAVLNGAHVIRTHDVRESKDCIKVIEAIIKAKDC
jgi:dihydropteroate synthase